MNLQQWVRLRYLSNFADIQFFLLTRGAGLFVNQKVLSISALLLLEQVWLSFLRGAATPWQWQISFCGSDHCSSPDRWSNLSLSMQICASATMKLKAGKNMFMMHILFLLNFFYYSLLIVNIAVCFWQRLIWMKFVWTCYLTLPRKTDLLFASTFSCFIEASKMCWPNLAH